MKKTFALLLLLPLLFGACKSKDKTDETTTVKVVNTDETKNPYIANSQDNATNDNLTTENLSGKVITLSSNDFIKKITAIDNEKGFQYKGQTPCIVDFYADWCRPCMGLKPIMEKFAQQYKGKIIIYKINVDKAQDICQAFGIQNIPTLLFFKPFTQPTKIVGAPSKSELETAIDKFLTDEK